MPAKMPAKTKIPAGTGTKSPNTGRYPYRALGGYILEKLQITYCWLPPYRLNVHFITSKRQLIEVHKL